MCLVRSVFSEATARAGATGTAGKAMAIPVFEEKRKKKKKRKRKKEKRKKGKKEKRKKGKKEKRKKKVCGVEPSHEKTRMACGRA